MTHSNIASLSEAANPTDPRVRIGHGHLRTADLDLDDLLSELEPNTTR